MREQNGHTQDHTQKSTSLALLKATVQNVTLPKCGFTCLFQIGAGIVTPVSLRVFRLKAVDLLGS